MKRFLALFTALMLTLLCTVGASAADVYDSEKRVFENDDTVLPYRLILPENYDETMEYPILLFLHGAGERGNDNKLQLLHCVQYLADNLPECIIVAPQCPVNNQWVDTPWANGAYSIASVPESNELKAVIELLDSLQEEFSIDSNRIYASGLSMGGFGAWDLMMRHNDYFAAGICVCGGGDVSQGEALKDTPLYIFHGTADTAVPISGSKNTVQAIKDAGGELVTYIEYAGAGHGIWNSAFAHEGMLEGLLTHYLYDRYPEKAPQPEESDPVSEESAEQSEVSVADEPTLSANAILLIITGVVVAAAIIFAVLTAIKRRS